MILNHHADNERASASRDFRSQTPTGATSPDRTPLYRKQKFPKKQKCPKSPKFVDHMWKIPGTAPLKKQLRASKSCAE